MSDAETRKLLNEADAHLQQVLAVPFDEQSARSHIAMARELLAKVRSSGDVTSEKPAPLLGNDIE